MGQLGGQTDNVATEVHDDRRCALDAHTHTQETLPVTTMRILAGYEIGNLRTRCVHIRLFVCEQQNFASWFLFNSWIISWGRYPLRDSNSLTWAPLTMTTNCCLWNAAHCKRCTTCTHPRFLCVCVTRVARPNTTTAAAACGCFVYAICGFLKCNAGMNV